MYTYISKLNQNQNYSTRMHLQCVCMCVRMCGVCGMSASITGNQRVRHASRIVMIGGGGDNVQCL